VKELFTLEEIRQLAYPDATARYNGEMLARLKQLAKAGLVEVTPHLANGLPDGDRQRVWRIPGGLDGFDRWCELLDAWRAADRLLDGPLLPSQFYRTVNDAIIGADGTVHVTAQKPGDEVVLKLHGSPGVVIPKNTEVDVARPSFFARGISEQGVR